MLASWANKPQEHFVLLPVDARHAPIGKPVAVFKGSLNASLVHPREVFRLAIVRRACAIIVAHNHPSGDLRPSGDDIELTRRLHTVADIVGIPLLDHIILSQLGHCSMREHHPEAWRPVSLAND
jgi:DNA repair protein RadC